MPIGCLSILLAMAVIIVIVPITKLHPQRADTKMKNVLLSFFLLYLQMATVFAGKTVTPKMNKTTISKVEAFLKFLKGGRK